MLCCCFNNVIFNDKKLYWFYYRSAIIAAVWLQCATAKEEARRLGGDRWREQLVLTWTKYKGRTLRWLIENDLYFVFWMLQQGAREGLDNGAGYELMNLHKRSLFELVSSIRKVLIALKKVIIYLLFLTLQVLCWFGLLYK